MTHDLDSYLTFCALEKLEHDKKPIRSKQEDEVACACAKYMQEASETKTPSTTK